MYRYLRQLVFPEYCHHTLSSSQWHCHLQNMAMTVHSNRITPKGTYKNTLSYKVHIAYRLFLYTMSTVSHVHPENLMFKWGARVYLSGTHVLEWPACISVSGVRQMLYIVPTYIIPQINAEYIALSELRDVQICDFALSSLRNITGVEYILSSKWTTNVFRRLGSLAFQKKWEPYELNPQYYWWMLKLKYIKFRLV